MRNIVLFFIIISYLPALSQDLTLDSLKTMKDEMLLSIFTAVESDSIKAEKVAKVYLNRAKKANDTIKIARGYDRLARIYHPEKNIIYADSIIDLTKNINHITYPGLGYILKASNYHILGNLISSTENFLLAYEFSLNSNNIPNQVHILNFLIVQKSIWGNKREALNLQEKRHDLIIHEDFTKYLIKSSRKGFQNKVHLLAMDMRIKSYLNFSQCYYKLNKIDSAFYYLNRAEVLNNLDKGIYFEFNSHWIDEVKMELYYKKRKFSEVIKISDSLLPIMVLKHENNAIFNIVLHKALALEGINKIGEAESLYHTADSIYENSNIEVFPNQRILFEKLLTFSKEADDQIIYLNKLISVDSIHKINYQYFEPEFNRKFETPKLIAEKESLIQGLSKSNVKKLILIRITFGLLIVCLGMAFYFYRKNNVYKKRFQTIISTDKIKNAAETENSKNSSELSNTIIKNILDSLETFEAGTLYLSSEMSLNTLAKSLKTNPRYLSRVVNLKKEKNFTQYINDLRVSFAIEEINTNRTFRNYTIKAIAVESGFNSAESFSKAFYRKFGIYPSYYIKMFEANKISQQLK